MPTRNNDSSRDVLVFLQIINGRVHPNSKELVLAANALVSGKNARLLGVAAAEELTESLRNELMNSSLCEIDFYIGENYKNFIAEHFSAALVDCALRRNPGSVLVGASPEGRAIAPMAAVALKTGVTADCTELELDSEGLLVQTRPAYGGDLMARIISPSARPQIATVRHGVLTGFSSKADTIIHVHDSILPSVSPLPRVLKKEVQDTQGEDEGRSNLILAVGGAVRQKEDLALFEELAATLNAPLFCSRSLVERAWLPPDRQIGLSGRSVAPKLLICMGISGSVQFLAGIRGAEKLCAVNTETSTPIMCMADYPLLGDMYEVTKALIEK